MVSRFVPLPSPEGTVFHLLSVFTSFLVQAKRSSRRFLVLFIVPPDRPSFKSESFQLRPLGPLGAFLMAGKLAIEIVEVDHWAVVNLADETGLTTYDASYLWLVGHLKGELITLDGKMQRAAKSFYL